MPLTIYTYHPQTGEFLGAGTAYPSPLEPGAFLLPDFATTLAPPQVGAHQVAVFDAEAWQIRPDWRGHTYWLADGTQHTITEIGVAPPAHAYPSAPPPPLETLKAQALAQVRAQRKDVFATLAGLQSEALALGDSATAQAIASVQQMLRDLPATDLTACQSEADIKATLEHAWELVAEAAAACAHTAFKL